MCARAGGGRDSWEVGGTFSRRPAPPLRLPRPTKGSRVGAGAAAGSPQRGEAGGAAGEGPFGPQREPGAVLTLQSGPRPLLVAWCLPAPTIGVMGPFHRPRTLRPGRSWLPELGGRSVCSDRSLDPGSATRQGWGIAGPVAPAQCGGPAGSQGSEPRSVWSGQGLASGLQRGLSRPHPPWAHDPSCPVEPPRSLRSLTSVRTEPSVGSSALGVSSALRWTLTHFPGEQGGDPGPLPW